MSRVPLGDALPKVRLPLPGPGAEELLDRLARTECPALTTRRARRAEASGAPHDPIVWAEASGANVVDTEGNRFVDLTSGFGAAAVGHAHPRIVEAVQRQAATLLHALGDLHPSDVKIRLLERLAAMAPWPDARVILGLSGSDAVEAALKTAMLATGCPGILAFDGSYHGLSHGPLAACGYGDAFRRPFQSQLNPHVVFAPWPAATASLADALAAVERACARANEPIGAVLVEPILGRGGVRLPPPGFLEALSSWTRARSALLIVDEVQTGLGRTGARFRFEAEGVVPDLICIGKALGGGLPISACIGTFASMQAWGAPDKEAIHTGTFFGHPLGSAAALATLDVIEGEGLAERARTVGDALRRELEEFVGRHSVVREVRGAGLLLGVELDRGDRALRLVRRLLEHGYLVLPAGPQGNVIQILPPLTIAERLLSAFVATFDALLGDEA